MNKAQKRTWLTFAISLATLLISAIAIAFIRRNQIDIYEPTRYRLLGALNTIPLILIVILEVRFRKKYYDERDKIVDRKAKVIGAVGAFIFLAGAGFILIGTTRMGSIKTPLIPYLVYLAAFVWFFISSAAALVQYGRGGKENE